MKGGGLFDGDDEDDLFSSTTSKPSTAPTTQGMLTQNDEAYTELCFSSPTKAAVSGELQGP